MLEGFGFGKTISRMFARLLGRLMGRRPEPPYDPHVPVRAPLNRGPSSRNSAVALNEPDESRSWMDFRRPDRRY
jgi:hypothetical protein